MFRNVFYLIFLRNKINVISMLIAVTIVIILIKMVKNPLHKPVGSLFKDMTSGEYSKLDLLLPPAENANEQLKYEKSENDILREMNIKEKRQCYKPRNDSSFFGTTFLSDVSEAKIPQGNSIFFLQTACSKTGIISLNAR